MAIIFGWVRQLFHHDSVFDDPQSNDYGTADDSLPTLIREHLFLRNERLLDRSGIEIRGYRTEGELFNQWRTLPHGSSRLTAVFVLAADLKCQLRTVIRRRPIASHLIIVPASGRWPSIDSPVDLMMARTELGWNTIDVCRDLNQALEGGFRAIDAGQRLVLFLPRESFNQPLTRLR